MTCVIQSTKPLSVHNPDTEPTVFFTYDTFFIFVLCCVLHILLYLIFLLSRPVYTAGLRRICRPNGGGRTTNVCSRCRGHRRRQSAAYRQSSRRHWRARTLLENSCERPCRYYALVACFVRHPLLRCIAVDFDSRHSRAPASNRHWCTLSTHSNNCAYQLLLAEHCTAGARILKSGSAAD